jgi:hypothetical protein
LNANNLGCITVTYVHVYGKTFQIFYNLFQMVQVD